MPEYFIDVRQINLASDGSRSGIDIYFQRPQVPPPPNADVEALHREYEETMFVLSNVQMSDSEFYTTFNQLLQGAYVGLKGPTFSLEAGRSQLSRVKETLVNFARKRRDAYLGQLLATGGLFAFASMVIAAGLYFYLPRQITDAELSTMYKSALSRLGPVLLLHPGVVLGVVFIGFVANRTITFDKVRTFDPYYFQPRLRFFYVSILSYVLFAALWFKFVMLGVGGYLLNDVKTDAAAGFAIGLICGIGEAVIVELLISRLKPVERGKL